MEFFSWAQSKRLPRSQLTTRRFRQRAYPTVSDGEWNDWRWQLRHRVRTLAELSKMVELSSSELAALSGGAAFLPFAVTPYYLSLLDPSNPLQPLRRTVIPVTDEFVRVPGEADDPLGEDGDSPVPGLVHRYPDRVLLLVDDCCSTICRYCTRARVVEHGSMTPSKARLSAALSYIQAHPEVRDVLLSGGDPLTLGDEVLDWLLTRLRAIAHVQVVRIGTKTPAVLPQRITPQLVRMLRKHQPLMCSLHFIHPDECSPEAVAACRRLSDAGIPLGSQTVLLKGVNDDARVMMELMHRLLVMRVRPYYLYQCDPISGSSHFRTSVDKGLEIIKALRGWTSGYAVPTFVIDAPGGGGKIPLQPDYLLGRQGDELLLQNYTGRIHRYPDPDIIVSDGMVQ